MLLAKDPNFKQPKFLEVISLCPLKKLLLPTVLLLDSGIPMEQSLDMPINKVEKLESLDIMISTLLSLLLPMLMIKLTDNLHLKLWSFKMKLEEDFVKFFLSKPTKLITLFMEELLPLPLMVLWLEPPLFKLNTLLACSSLITFHGEQLELENNSVILKVHLLLLVLKLLL
jgi:hypothetical protein